MTPADYLRVVVLPTLAELLAEPADQRRAYLSCITAAHLADHVAVTLERRPDGKPDVRRVRNSVNAIGSYSATCLAIVEGVSNGTKHAQPDPNPNRAVKFGPGHERLVPAFALGIEGSDLGEGRWSRPGLLVLEDVNLGGVGYLIDDCVRATVRAYTIAFPICFAGVNLKSIAQVFQRYAELDATPWLPSGAPP